LCRPGDWQHARRVAKWVRVFAPLDLNECNLLIKAAYIHDIGWRGLFPKNKKLLTIQELLKNEPRANNNTLTYVTAFLLMLHHSKKEISEILKFIRAADEYESHDEIEAIIVDADNLSKLNIQHFREKFVKQCWLEIFDVFLSQKFKLTLSSAKASGLDSFIFFFRINNERIKLYYHHQNYQWQSLCKTPPASSTDNL